MALEPARVLVADPPWKFGDALPGAGRGAAKHYPCMPLSELVHFPLPPLDRDCVLLLWRVSAMRMDALLLASAWGFKPHSELVWRKLTRNGNPWFGMGRIVRGAHESCLIAVRGRPLVRSHSVRSVFDAPVGAHSAKPDAFYELVERLYAGPYTELFARRQRAGWQCLGNQLDTAPANDNGQAP